MFTWPFIFVLSIDRQSDSTVEQESQQDSDSTKGWSDVETEFSEPEPEQDQESRITDFSSDALLVEIFL